MKATRSGENHGTDGAGSRRARLQDSQGDSEGKPRTASGPPVTRAAGPRGGGARAQERQRPEGRSREPARDR